MFGVQFVANNSQLTKQLLIFRTEKSEVGVGDFRAMLARFDVIIIHFKVVYLYFF